MGITVISNAGLNPAGKAPGGQQAADSAGSDFSNLLSQQISGLGRQLLATAAPQLALTDGNPADSDARSAQDGDAIGGDIASILAAAGLLPALQPTPPATQPGKEISLLASSGKGSEKELGSIGAELDLDTGKGEILRGVPNGTDGTLGSITGNGLRGETANIAVDAQPAANGSQNFAATLAAQSAAQHVQNREETSAATPAIATPIHDSHWAQDFGDKVTWLAKNNQQVAQLSITPPQLGPMHITLNLNGDQASAFFVSPHAEVRQAISDAMPQLRDMLASAGISLGQANVGAQLPQQQNGTPQQFSTPSRSEGDKAILRADSSHGTATLQPASRAGRGLVDLFA